MTSSATRCNGCADASMSFAVVRHLLGISLLVWSGAAAAGEWDVQGVVGAESRLFLNAPAHPGQESARLDLTVTAVPEFHFVSDGGDDRVSIVAMIRKDRIDAARSFTDLKELYWLHIGDGWDVRIGVDRVFWGVTESRHLVDIINQTDLSGDLAEEDRLGQLMINLGVQTGAGDFNLLAMPRFRPRRFPEQADRLRPGIVIDNDNEVFIGGAGKDHVDIALRYFNVIGDYDVGLSWFHGVSREPSFLLQFNAQNELRLVPVYEVIDQAGADIQLTRGPFLWKLEAIERWITDDRFSAMVAGVEYTMYGIRGNTDLGLLFEYLRDGRDALTMPTPFDDDVFVGARLTLNDVDDTSMLAGAIIDTDSGAGFFSLEFETRIADGLTLDLELRAVDDGIGKQFDFGIGNDDYAALSLEYSF